MDYKKLYTPTECMALYNTAKIKYDPTSYSLKGNLITNHSTEQLSKEHIAVQGYGGETTLKSFLEGCESRRFKKITGLGGFFRKEAALPTDVSTVCIQQDNLYVNLEFLSDLLVDLSILKTTNAMQALVTMCIALNSSKSCAKDMLALCLKDLVTLPYSKVHTFEYLKESLCSKSKEIPILLNDCSVDIRYVPSTDSELKVPEGDYQRDLPIVLDSLFGQFISVFEVVWAWTTLPEELKTCFIALCHSIKTAYNFEFFGKYVKLGANEFEVSPEVANAISEPNPEKRYTLYQDLLSKELKNIYALCEEFYLRLIPAGKLIHPLIAVYTSFVMQISLANFRVNHIRILYEYCKANNYLPKDDTTMDLIDDMSALGCSFGTSGGTAGVEEEKDLFTVETPKTCTMSTPDCEDTAHESEALYASLDGLKTEFKCNKYDYNVSDKISTDAKSKSKYDAVATKVELVNKLLIKRIRDIKTYNIGGKNPGRAAGRLDRKAMYRYKYDPNIFYNNTYKTVESDLAFGIILDESGSMSGKGIENGRITMIVLHETLKALGINHSIIGHTSDYTHHCQITRYQSFREDKTYTTCKNYAIVETKAKWGNCDSGALYFMERALDRVTNKDKICLIFSDGAPTECTGTELKDQVKAMERKGIKVIGIGINFEQIAKYYKDYANGRNLSDMLNIVAKILEEYVLKKKDK